MSPSEIDQYSQIDPELFSTLIEISSEAVWVNELDTGRRYWLASDANRKKYKIPSEHIGPEFWRNNIHPDDIDRAILDREVALTDKSIKDFVCQYRFRGESQWYVIRDKMRFIRNELGIVTRIIGLWEDITDAVSKEHKVNDLLFNLENDKNRFRIISELSNAVMWEVDIRKDRVYWTSDSKTLVDFGLVKEDFTIDDWIHCIHPEDYKRSAERFFAAVNSSEGIYNDQYRIIKTDGSIAYILDRGLIIRDDQGNAVRAIGGWVDVTETKKYERELSLALKKQEEINQELAKREEALARSEEELKEANEQLLLSNRVLTDRDQIISKLQQFAKIGSWEYDPNIGKFLFSDEIYNIHGIEIGYEITKPEDILQFYESNSQIVISDLILNANQGTLGPFDVVLRVQTPLGHKKWVRICGWTVQNEGNRLPFVIGLTYDITYSKEAEERLKSSEEKFSKAFHNNPDLMVLMRKEDWIIVDINNKVYSMLGYTRDELLGTVGTDLRMFVHQSDREAFFDKFYRDEQVEMESEWYCKDQSIIHVLLSFNTLEFDNKAHVIATIKNISDRKAAEEKFSKAFDLSPDLIMIFRESDLTLVECNRYVEKLSGYKRAEIIGKSAIDFDLWLNAEDREAHWQAYQQKGSVFMESTFLRKDRTTFDGNISSKRIHMQSEDHMLVVVRDITERKMIEQERMESEANLSAVFDNSNLLIWSVDLNFRVVKANKRFREFMKTRYNAKIVTGQEKNVIYEDENVAQLLYETWKERYQRALNGEKYKLIENYEGLYAEFSLNPIVDNAQIIGVVVFAEDITERVLREQELKDALNKIAELKLMALRSVMNPHFIFNALNSIQFFIAQNDRKNAINYLSTFSRLIRGILTHSVNNRISLNEEIEQLKNYISLEQLRFENKFDYQITIDETLDLEGVEIPPMLIQPYVENAILHGLYNKVGKGSLNIAIIKEKNAILFEIRDDGVGRAVSQELRNRNFPTHKSMGTALTEERLKLINSQFKVSFEIVDLHDKMGQPAGTCSKIWLKN